MTFASEQRPFELAREMYPIVERHAKSVIQRIKAVHKIPAKAQILDIGSGQGLFLIACARMGYTAVGVEPRADARDMAQRLARWYGAEVRLVDGIAERLPAQTTSFDLIHANSVMEHVGDPAAAFHEANRVLRPGGVFWFSAASSVCPRQQEIRGFPGFGWYPDALKSRIMTWAKEHHPELISHTETPAYQWFTPWKARRMLREAGFGCVFDRWDLRLPSEGGRTYRYALRLIQRSAIAKFACDVVVPCCAYAAIK